MKVLYYIEPSIELNNPLFRLGSIRNHISKEINALKSTNENVDIILLCSTEVFHSARAEDLLSNVKVIHFRQDKIHRKMKSSNLSSLWYSDRYNVKDIGNMEKLVHRELKEWVPDIIVCYEGAAPFLKSLYPNSVFLDSYLGIFSRAPFPETACLDIFGIYKKSYLSTHSDHIKNKKATLEEKKDLHALRLAYLDFVDRYSPIKNDSISTPYKKNLLLSLQVSDYFAFNDNLPSDLCIENQIDLLKHVLSKLPSNIGLYVTFHSAEYNKEFDSIIRDIQIEYENLIFCPQVQNVKWCSQYLIKHVDGVISVSSAVGLLSAFLNKHVFSIGDSHLGIFNSGDIEDANLILQDTPDFDNIICHLLGCYYFSMDAKVHDGEWLYKYFSRAIKLKSGDAIDEHFYDALYDSNAIRNLTKSMRFPAALSDICNTKNFNVSSIDIEKAKNEILKNNIVSFDVFDTLITRNIIHPNDVFDIMEPSAFIIFRDAGCELSSFGSYRQLRERAANRVIREAKKNGQEDIKFNDIYEEIRRLACLSKEAVLKLRRLEIETEKNVISRRAVGYELYMFAAQQKKKIILISDMYLSSEQINFLLKKQGYQEHDALYCSSEVMKTKKTGTLFDYVLEKQGEKFVHFGDNVHSDIIMALNSGLSAFHLPLINEIYLNSKNISPLYKEKDLTVSIGMSILHGIISRKYYDNIMHDGSWFNGNPYRLGYEACGSILLAFTKWIIEQSIRDGVEHLYFLARDGFLVKEIYDKISPSYKNAPKSHYLLASRRCYNTASLYTEQDILESTKLSFSKVSLAKIIDSRYGISPSEINTHQLNKCGYDSIFDIVDIKKKSQLNKFKRFLTEIKDLILNNSKVERNALCTYFSDMGLYTNKNISVVDIGHNATLQDSLGRLLGNRTDIGGYYFMTYFGAQKIYDKGFNVRGFLSDFEDNRVSRHPYCKNVGMFEFLFLPAIPSFKRFYIKDKVLYDVYVDGDESKRFSVINEVHKGIIDFVDDVVRVTSCDAKLFLVSKQNAIKNYISFIESPTYLDAMVFSDLSFVDQFGGSDSRYIIAAKKHAPVTASNYHQYISESWWREGAAVIIDKTTHTHNISTSVQLSPNTTLLNIKSARKFLFRKKLMKLRRNPRAFILDSKAFRFINFFYHKNHMR